MSTAPDAAGDPGRPRAPSRRGPRATPKHPRRRAREFALQALYGVMVGGTDAGAADAHVRELDGFAGIDLPWYDRQLHGTVAERAALEAAFGRHLDRPLAQLSPIEHGILLLGTWELAHAPDVPWKVAIDAAVELAKSFGGTDGHKFVNGVLDRVARDLRVHEVARDAGRRADPEPTDAADAGADLAPSPPAADPPRDP
jgi:N utilization substance protein B